MIRLLFPLKTELDNHLMPFFACILRVYSYIIDLAQPVLTNCTQLMVVPLKSIRIKEERSGLSRCFSLQVRTTVINHGGWDYRDWGTLLRLCEYHVEYCG